MLTSLAFIFLGGMGLGALAQKLKLPSLIGFLLAGIILGPFAFNLLDDTILLISPDLRRFALIIILTRAGLALNLEDLKRVGRPAMLMCFLPACFEIAGTVLLAPWLLGISYVEAAVLGAVLGAVSPAVIVPRMLKLMEGGYGQDKSIPQLIIAGASVDDVFVIVLFTAFISVAAGGGVSPASFVKIPVSIITGVFLGGAVGRVIVLFFKKYHLRDSAKALLLLSISFLLMAIEEKGESYLPFSGLLAVMAMSAAIFMKYPLLANRLSGKFSSLWVGAEILLFVLVGATVDTGYALSAGKEAVILIFAALIFRMAGVCLCLVKTNLNYKQRLFCMIAYMPKATVQAAIGGIPMAMGLPAGKLVLTVAVLAILITAPLGAIGIDKTYGRLLSPYSHKGSK